MNKIKLLLTFLFLIYESHQQFNGNIQSHDMMIEGDITSNKANILGRITGSSVNAAEINTKHIDS